MPNRPDPYVRKDPDDLIRSGDWNELQVRAREDILAHRHTGNDDGTLLPGTAIDRNTEISVKTLSTSADVTAGGDLRVNGKLLLGDIADLLATVKSLQADKLSRAGDTVGGTLRVQRNLLVSGMASIGTESPEYTLDVNGSVRLGGFSARDADEWPRVVWCRDGSSWDEGLLKHSSTRGFFGRSGIGIHIHESRDWGIWSSGWNPLLGIEGGTGNTKVKGRLEVGNSDLYFSKTDHQHTAYGNAPGYAAIENSADYGALMILGRSVGTQGEPVHRVVKLWDYLAVNGNLDVSGSIIRKVSMATGLGPSDQTANGQIVSRILSFTKRYAETAIRVVYCDNLRVRGSRDPVGARWEIRIDGNHPPGGKIFQDLWMTVGHDHHRPSTIIGYAQGIPAGTHTIGVWVVPTEGMGVSEVYTGWYGSRWTLEAQEVWI